MLNLRLFWKRHTSLLSDSVSREHHHCTYCVCFLVSPRLTHCCRLLSGLGHLRSGRHLFNWQRKLYMFFCRAFGFKDAVEIVFSLLLGKFNSVFQILLFILKWSYDIFNNLPPIPPFLLAFKPLAPLSLIAHIPCSTHVSRADYLVLDNHLVYPSLGRLFLLLSAFLSCL